MLLRFRKLACKLWDRHLEPVLLINWVSGDDRDKLSLFCQYQKKKKKNPTMWLRYIIRAGVSQQVGTCIQQRDPAAISTEIQHLFGNCYENAYLRGHTFKLTVYTFARCLTRMLPRGLLSIGSVERNKKCGIFKRLLTASWTTVLNTNIIW